MSESKLKLSPPAELAAEHKAEHDDAHGGECAPDALSPELGLVLGLGILRGEMIRRAGEGRGGEGF